MIKLNELSHSSLSFKKIEEGLFYLDNSDFAFNEFMDR